jgi:antitoxin (DNA-binding transcriptional repressor) of toxin-antitoxin stability system
MDNDHAAVAHLNQPFVAGLAQPLPNRTELDKMSNMKTATIRQVQHGLARVIAEVQRGQEFAVTKHGKVVARIVPATRATKSLHWPDSRARMDALMAGNEVTGKPASEIVRDQRGERL